MCTFEIMLEITIVGNGNLGSALANAIDNLKDFKLLEWYGRTWDNNLPPQAITKLSKLKNADLYILAVSDNSIKKILDYIDTNCFVIHCSGATSIGVFKNHPRSGVLFPIQTISKTNNTLFKYTPFCIEAKYENDLDVLKNLVLALEGSYELLDSIQRANIHLSAVWINNFVNHMISKGKKICADNNIPFSLLKPMLKKTINQALINDPNKIQTGPARRGDNETLEIHSQLINNLNDKKLYKIITKSIQNSYE